jgi:hypothetical protein
MGEVDNNNACSSDGENNGDDDAEELPHRSLKQREIPSGLAYKLRHTDTRAKVRRYIGRTAYRLKLSVTTTIDCVCSGTARRKRVIALAREGADASSYVRRWTSLGSMLNSSSTHTRVILVALPVKYPELLSALSESKAI